MAISASLPIGTKFVTVTQIGPRNCTGS